jgi:glyoxylase-like metal-dependent hydrolase (beta-lactamase superfamily II)
VQEVFKGIFNLEPGFRTDGAQFDHLFADGERFTAGDLAGEALAVPGHTPACIAYRFGDAVFVGDTMFLPDVGSARCDFPGGDARQLYRSVRKLLALPGDTRLFMCHDYRPTGRRPARPRLPSSAPPTSMCTTASRRMRSSRCARRAMRRWRCPC